jgi:hypothetical protein
MFPAGILVRPATCSKVSKKFRSSISEISTPTASRFSLTCVAGDPQFVGFVPSYWEERRDDKGLTRDWPDVDLPQDAPDWVRQLPGRRTWLEQEIVAVDPRFGQFLEMEIQRALSK